MQTTLVPEPRMAAAAQVAISAKAAVGRLRKSAWKAASEHETYDPHNGNMGNQQLLHIGCMNGRCIWINRQGEVFHKDAFCRAYTLLPIGGLHEEHLAKLSELLEQLGR